MAKSSKERGGPTAAARRRAAADRRYRIKSALLARGRTMADVGRRCGVSRHMVSHVVAGRKRSPRVFAALAKATGLPMSVVRVAHA